MFDKPKSSSWTVSSLPILVLPPNVVIDTTSSVEACDAGASSSANEEQQTISVDALDATSHAVLADTSTVDEDVVESGVVEADMTKGDVVASVDNQTETGGCASVG